MAQDNDWWKQGATAVDSAQPSSDWWKQGSSPVDAEPEPGFTARFGQGASRALDSAKTALTDDPNEIAKIAADQARTALPQTPLQRQLADEFKPYVEAANKAEGFVDNVTAWGAAGFKRAGQLLSNPAEAGKMIAEQLPNSLPGLAGGFAGAKGGAALGTMLAGPVGTVPGAIVGGIAGGFAGSYGLEKGAAMQEQVQQEAQKRNIDIQNQGAVAGMVAENQSEFDATAQRKGVGTAGTDAILNVATMGLAGMGGRALAKEAQALGKAVQEGAISAADASTKIAALQAASAARNTLGAKAARGAGVVGAEMVGEGASEAVGQQYAYGEVDAGQVIDESLMGLGTGGAMALGGKAFNKAAGIVDQDATTQTLAAAQAEIERRVAALPDHQQNAERARLNAQLQAEARMGGLADEEMGAPDVAQGSPSDYRATPAWAKPPEDAAPDYASADDEIFQSTGTPQRVDPVREAVRQAADAGGALSAAAGVAMDSGAAPTFMPPEVAEQPQEPQPEPVVLQNRDRTSNASIAQMQEIAAAPDYMRAGPSREMATGAPVVFGDLPGNAALGRQEVVVDGRGGRVQAQYAVVDAADVIASNNADGTTVAEYANGLPGKLRAVAGNGRTAGLQAAYQQGTANNYTQELLNDAGALGIDPQAVASMQRPVLVRVMGQSDVTADMGDRTNITSTQKLSPVEQASNDSRRFSVENLSFDEQGNPTAQSIGGFVSSMPVAERGDMLNPDGTPTRQAVDRLMAATFKQAYDSDELVQLHAQATDPDARSVLAAAADASGVMAALRGTGDFDVRGAVTDAVKMAVNAARQGLKLSDVLQNADFDMNPEAYPVATFLAQNIRSPKAMAEGLRRWGQLALQNARTAEENQYQGGLLGPAPTLSRAEIFARIGDAYNPTEQAIAARAQPQAPVAEQASIEPTQPSTQPAAMPVPGNFSGTPSATMGTRTDAVAGPGFGPRDLQSAIAQIRAQKQQAAQEQPTTPTQQGFTDGTQADQAQQGSAQPAQTQQAAAPDAVARHPTWRKNAIQAGRVARDLGLAPKGKRLAQIVAEVDAHDAAQNQAVPLVAPAQAAIENVADAQPAAPALTSYTPADIQSQQQAQEQAAKSEASAKRAADNQAKADDDRQRIAAASVAAADSFELGQDPMDSLTGQQDVFADAPQQQAATKKEAASAQPASNSIENKTESTAQQAQSAIEKVADKAPAKRKLPPKLAAKAAEVEAQRAAYFAPGNVVASYAGHDRVVAYTPADAQGHWSVTVQAVEKQDGQWVNAPGKREHTHSTQPDARAMRAGPVMVAKQNQAATPVAQAQEATDSGADATALGAMFSRAQPTPQDFVPNPDGGLEYGEITPEMGKAMRRQAGVIRLQQGVQNPDGTGWGLAHIEARHGKQIENLGYGSVPEFVAESVRGFDQIWQAGKTVQLVMARTGKASRATFLQLEVQKDGDFYRVNSAFPVSKSYLESKEKKEGWKPLWSRYPVPADASGASGFVGQSPKAGETAPMVSNQSGSDSVAPKDDAANYARADAPMSTDLARTLLALGRPPARATKESVRAAVRELVNGLGLLPNSLGRVVVATSAEIKQEWEPLIGPTGMEASGGAGQAQGFYDPKSKTVFLIADHIQAGDELGVAAHELMHKHGPAVLGKEGWNQLHGAIGGWAKAKAGSMERIVHDEAARRVQASGPELSNQELFPYAVQVALEMGVRPNAMAPQGTVARWLAQVRAALRQVWGKIAGGKGDFNSLDLVNMAFGIAQRENPAHAGELDGAVHGTNESMTNQKDAANEIAALEAEIRSIQKQKYAAESQFPPRHPQRTALLAKIKDDTQLKARLKELQLQTEVKKESKAISPKATDGLKLGAIYEKDIPPERDGFLRLYHGGRTDGFTSVPDSSTAYGFSFNGLFASTDTGSSWRAHGKGSNYFADINREKVLTDYALNYEIPHAEMASALKQAMRRLSDDDFDIAVQAAIEDKSQTLSDEDLLRVFPADSVGEASWKAQAVRGEVARILGYEAVEMSDEHGTSYLMVPGVKLTQVQSDASEDNPDIRYSRATVEGVTARMGDAIKAVTVTNIKERAGWKLTDWLGMGLQALGRRQLVDIYGDVLPLDEYNRLAAQMEADKNEVGAGADQLATAWGKLKDERQLAELMHDSTLAQIDPDKDHVAGDEQLRYRMLRGRFDALTPEAQKVYRDARGAYQGHHANVRTAIKERIERSELKGERKAELLKQMDDEFFKSVKGVYFPLSRFGQYVVAVKGADGKVHSVGRAETKAEAEALRRSMLAAFPQSQGYKVDRVILGKEFIATRDAVGRGFMTELYGILDKQVMDAAQRAELEDTLGQLYLSALPDLSWAKHGIHRKGTPGFSQDARRAYAQNMFHGARYLAKLRYSDLMQDELAAMQEHTDNWKDVDGFNQNNAQRVVDEFNKRHESLMNPKGNPVSTALTSLGFVFYLGLSPASAMVNLSQTALVAYPVMGAKWGFGKASAALLKASEQTLKGKNDITASLTADERRAYDEAVRSGTIDVTMAHDLAGIAQGEDAGVMWKIRPVMKAASFMFHHAERFNRQVTFIAAYRLAREAGADHKSAFADATKATYDGHFDYSSGNRPRIMQGNVARVVTLFKQYGQNMVYTLARNAYKSVQGTEAEKKEARKVFAGLLVSHGMAAGALGLPMVTTLLAAASMLGGDDDEPWDAKVALQNLLADTFGQKTAEVMAHGLSRLTPWDVSGRVGLDRLILPDVQEGLEGQRLGEAAMTAALGPVAGIGVNMLKGLQQISEGQFERGLESMLPTALRGPLKAVRYANEGVQDKSGISILDEVSTAGTVGQAMGFSPSEARNAQEGKSAVMAHDRALGERRSELLGQFARAAMDKDADGQKDARAEISQFNAKHPGRAIQVNHMMASVRGRQKRIDQAQDGVYLPKNRRDSMDVGRFALGD